MRRLTTALVGLAFAFSLASCGGEESDEDQVRGVTKDYAEAFVNEDFEKACELLTTEARQQVLTGGAFLGGGDCPEVLEKAWNTLDDADKKEIGEGEIKVTSVKISGNTAEARINKNIDGDDDPTLLRKKGDSWLIDADPDDSE